MNHTESITSSFTWEQLLGSTFYGTLKQETKDLVRLDLEAYLGSAPLRALALGVAIDNLSPEAIEATHRRAEKFHPNEDYLSNLLRIQQLADEQKLKEHYEEKDLCDSYHDYHPPKPKVGEEWKAIQRAAHTAALIAQEASGFRKSSWRDFFSYGTIVYGIRRHDSVETMATNLQYAMLELRTYRPGKPVPFLWNFTIPGNPDETITIDWLDKKTCNLHK